MQIEVITPEGCVCNQEADNIVIPAVDGEMGILDNHASMLAEVGNGVAIIKQGSAELKVKLNGGFINIDNNVVDILAESASILN